MTHENITTALHKLKQKIQTTKLSCSSFLPNNENEDNSNNTISYMLDAFIDQIDQKILAECKHDYYETLAPSKRTNNMSVRVTKCHKCSTVFPYSHSKL